MAYNPTQPKTINGQSVTQVAFRRAICEALAAMPSGGSVADLLPHLGPEWDTASGRKLLNSTLVNMARSNRLARHPSQRGVYTVTHKFTRMGVSAFDYMEKSVVDSIRKRGGFARFSEIADDHNLRACGEDLAEIRRRRARRHAGRDTDDDDLTINDVSGARQMLLKVLATSLLVRQDFFTRNRDGDATTDGWFSLPMDELNRMTLRGRFAGIIVKATHQDLGLPGSYFDERDSLFSRVGDVYRTAREARGISLIQMADRKHVAGALMDLARVPAVNRDKRSFYAGVTRANEHEMRAAGASLDEIAAYRDSRDADRDGSEARAEMLRFFEEGFGEPGHPGPNLHINAPVSFYEALAAELGIDPVAASRGVLQIDTRGDRIHIERPKADRDRLVALDLARERRREGLDDRGTFHGHA